MNPEFDRKLGGDFLGSIPEASGIYIFRDEMKQPIYVGKAKNLKRRLSQYRLATRKKPHRKLRLIVKKAASLEYQVCPSEQEALLLENQWIQKYRPMLNVAGAFFFMYPCLGMKRDPQQPRTLAMAYGSSPDELERLEFKLYGSFRSRQVVTAAYAALCVLLKYIGHHTPAERKQFGAVPYARLIVFRQLDEIWLDRLHLFLEGRDFTFVKELALLLLEKPQARLRAAEVEEHLKALHLFFHEEAKRLRGAMETLRLTETFVTQENRDRIFLEAQGFDAGVNIQTSSP